MVLIIISNIHNRGVLLVLGADKKCGDATRIIIIGNLRFRIRKTSANFLSGLTSLFS